MSLAFGLKRLGILVAASTALGFAALLLASHLIPADKVRDAIAGEIRAATGLTPVVRGSLSVSLFPSSVVTFSDVVLGEDGKEIALRAETLSARLRLWPLLVGRIEAGELTLLHPLITVALDSEGRSNWSSLREPLSAALKPAGGTRSSVSFSEIRVLGGMLTFRDPRRGISETLSDLEMSMAWPAITRSLVATGRFTWRKQPIETTISLGDLHAALIGERSGLKIRMSGAPIKLAFDGSMGHRPSLKMEGVVSADGPSLRNLAQWVGQELTQGSGFGRYALKAQLNVVGGVVSLPQLTAELDGNAAEGMLTLTAGVRPSVQGTLHAESIDIAPYLTALQVFRGREREWSRTRINVEGLRRIDVDVRFSAARLQIANARLTRIAAAINLLDGKLTATLGESAAFGGLVKGSLGIQALDTGIDLRSQVHFSGVDVEACLSELFGIRRLEGKGNLLLAMEANGDTVMGLTQNLSGSADLTAEKGALAGINVEQLLRRLERRPLSGGGDFRSGRTSFERLKVKLKIAQGTAAVEDVALEGNAVRLALAGSASIPTRDLDLKGTASLINASTGTGFELPFVVQGPWDDPIMLPDPQILIRRSGAAAPLLDAVRDRKTRDAVRSVIEQIARPPASETGVAPAAAPLPQR